MQKLIGNIESRYKSVAALLLALLWFGGSLFAQGERKFIRQGNKEFQKEKYSESEISYRRAIDKNKSSADAVFNTGDALYRQEKYEDAGKQFTESHRMNEDREKKASSMYNLGNSFLKSGKLKESIEAYKNSLRLDPGNIEAKYNLAYAQDRLKEQEQQQQQQQQQNQQNQDQNQDQNKEQNQDQDQDKKDDQKENENQDQQQPNDQQQSMSREDAERLLNAIANDEKEVQEKVKEAKAAKQRVKTLKNW
ncbi:MAG: tetratricopeptide repeat protein [Bacteroidales bacterium]